MLSASSPISSLASCIGQTRHFPRDFRTCPISLYRKFKLLSQPVLCFGTRFGLPLELAHFDGNGQAPSLNDTALATSFYVLHGDGVGQLQLSKS